MAEIMENLFHNIEPYAAEIAPALLVVLVVSFAAGWFCAQTMRMNRRGKRG